jgi:ankyrin repeat protein
MNKMTIHDYCCTGNLYELQKLLIIDSNSSVCLDIKNSEGNTPLTIAVINGHKQIVEELLKAGASIDGWNLHSASAYGSLEIVRALIQSGVHINEKNCTGDTPLHIASEIGYLDIVQKLINSGSYSNEKSLNGCTPLHYASGCNCLDIVIELIKHGANVDEQDQYGYTCLHCAAIDGHVEIIRYLIKYCDLSIKNNKGEIKQLLSNPT